MTPDITDTTTDEPDVAQTAQTAEAPQSAATKAPRETSTIAGSLLTFTAPGRQAEDYDAREVHNDAAHSLKMVGLRHALSTSTDRAKTWAAIKSGTYGLRAPAAAKPLDAKRQAIANALVEHTRKTDAPVALADAEERARGMNRQQVEAEMLHPAVIKQYQKIAAPKSALFG